MNAALGREYVLTLSCPDKPGIVYAVSSFLVQHSANILASQQYGEPGTESPDCLNDLLFRWKTGSLPVDVTGVVSNHPDFGELVAPYRIPFWHIPVTPRAKAAAESQLLEVIDGSGADLIVLARYMQILSGEVCKRMEGRMINIHHSFLPSFKGAKPYHQAHARGVKLVGATAHYVTPDLDEGPIIEQDVVRVNHTLSPERLAEAGRDVEAQVLARAVIWHAEHRVLLNGDRTVVFH